MTDLLTKIKLAITINNINILEFEVHEEIKQKNNILNFMSDQLLVCKKCVKIYHESKQQI